MESSGIVINDAKNAVYLAALEATKMLLNTEHAKFWPNQLPEMFECMKDRDACGCIMALNLTEQAEEREKCYWTEPADFRNRNGAKVAVAHTAFERGARRAHLAEQKTD